jgi:hypothetical protein
MSVRTSHWSGTSGSKEQVRSCAVLENPERHLQTFKHVESSSGLARIDQLSRTFLVRHLRNCRQGDKCQHAGRNAEAIVHDS